MEKYPGHEIPVMLGKDAWHKQLELDIADGIPVIVSLIDIDELKGINDAHSHERGDEAIRDLLAITGQFIADIPELELPDVPLLGIGMSRTAKKRQQPILAQPGYIGGDEVAILWYTESEDYVNQKMTELRGQHIKYLADERNQDLIALGVGLSFGTAALKPGMSKKELMECADHQLKIDKIARIHHTWRQRLLLRTARVALQLAGVRPRSSQKHFDAIDYQCRLRRQGRGNSTND